MKKKLVCLLLACTVPASFLLSGCSANSSDGKIQIELVHYKPEAVDVFEQLEEEFNSTHDDIHLTISSPNDAMTVLKTRFVREDYPDILGIGGDINYSAGVLYTRAMFKEHGWEIPKTWEELMALCEEIQKEGILPFYFGFKDVWTCLAPWNSLAVDLAPADVCKQVNAGNATFSEEYREVAEKMLELIKYGEEGPFAYGYNDACTAFANGQSAMFAIGSYAIPQIKSVNPDMDIDSFVMPGSSDADGNTLNSGVDLMFAVTEECENKEAAYEVIDFLLADENVQAYLDDQNAVPCKTGDFTLAPNLDGMKSYIESGNMTDYQDHYYPAEMAVDAQIQTFLINQDPDAFLKKFDSDWARYNRDIIRMVEEYNAQHK